MAKGGASCTAALLLSCPPQGHHPCCHSMTGRRTEPQSLHQGQGTGASQPHHKPETVPVSHISSHTRWQMRCYGCTTQTPLSRAAHGGTGKSQCTQSPAFRLVHPTQLNSKPLNWSPGNLPTLCTDTNHLRR